MLLQVVLALSLLVLTTLWLADLVAPGAQPRLPLPLQVRLLFFLAVLPAVALGVLRLAARARLELGGTVVRLHLRTTSYEIPRSFAVEPWILPLPRPGLRLRLPSGRRFVYRLAAPDPTALVAALAPERAGERWVVSARARHATRLLRHVGLKLGLVPLIPTFLLFRVQQIIAGGDLLGEYRFYGLWKYLDTLLGGWLFVMAQCLVWAAAGRVVVELAAALSPRLRWPMEVLALLVFLAGIAFGLVRIFYG